MEPTIVFFQTKMAISSVKGDYVYSEFSSNRVASKLRDQWKTSSGFHVYPDVF